MTCSTVAIIKCTGIYNVRGLILGERRGSGNIFDTSSKIQNTQLNVI